MLILTGGRVVDPSLDLDALRDIRIESGLIVEIAESIDPAAHPGAELLDARGRVVAPGFIDMHVHLREPGQTWKESIATGAAAAVAGGFTAVAAMPNTLPALDEPERIEEVRRRALAANLARVYPVGAITKRREGVELAPFWRLFDAGAVAFSDDGSTIADAYVLRQAALYARDVPGPFISHCEDHSLKGDAVMHESLRSITLGLRGSPGLAEEIIVARDLLIAGEVRRPWHIAHLSTARSLALMRFAREQGIAATCEVTPHHLLLSDAFFHDFTATAKVNPPLRSEDDAKALRDGVRDGTIEVLATDHAPHTEEEKALLLDDAPVGFSGLEIAVGAYAEALPDLPLARFVALLSCNPARVLGIPGGTLAPGSPADLTLFGEALWRVDPGAFHSRGKNTPFAGRLFRRRAWATIVGGRVVMRDGLILPGGVIS